MAESCPANKDTINSPVQSLLDQSENKQECTSPSPTETVCLDSLSIDPPNELPGPSSIGQIQHECSENNLPNGNPGPSHSPTNLKSEPSQNTKNTFLGELGLGENDEYEEEAEKEETWEDCIEEQYNGESNDDLEVAVEATEGYSVDGVSESLEPNENLNSNQSKIISSEINWRKRKLDMQNGFPSKRLSRTTNKTVTTSATSLPTLQVMPRTSRYNVFGSGVPSNATSDLIKRAPIPSKDNPPPEMIDWLKQFQKWTNAERILAINELIARCEPTQVRHMMQVIEPQFQRDFISLLPRELALSVLSFLEPRDLLRAAQTCRSWRFLAEDNLLWKEKCKEAGIDIVQLRRSSPRSPSNQGSPWKAAFMRQHVIEMNWRKKPLRPPKMLKGHDDHVITCLQFCGNRIVSGSDDNTLKVWSATTGKCLRTLVGHTGGVWSSQMSGHIIISGSTDRTLKVWDVETGDCIHTLYGHTSTVRCMHLHENKVVSGSRDATLRVWNIHSGECLHVLVGHMAAVRCVQYDGKLVVSGAYDYMVKVWNPEREECLHTLQGHTNRVYSLQFDGVHVVSGSLDTSIRVWEVQTGACRHTLMGHQSLTSGMELKNNILVSGNADSTVKVWDIVTGQCLQTLSGMFKHQSAVTCLQFNNSFVITSSDDGTVKLWDVKTGEFIRNLVALDSGGSGGVVWRIRANDTKLVCAVGSRNGTEETKLLVLDFDIDSNSNAYTNAR
ncbi:PREDICTED: F-box/WD repeat-containing protein 7 isoform X2 [Nicrophorus vespilloides]|uniref:F-box/WD repeat-containing protein 7 isoform X2 n=1 Tax=Nicrophorus vespilloides TaxID=110193 RepID=A0ABM1MAW5_NICVS|nr:PREDICTED: F-box/WD repeat-containing protein 7 isoform X2 [Nicrophorus vespilloides]